eukprot:2161985-Prymnesium_polylepis.1
MSNVKTEHVGVTIARNHTAIGIGDRSLPPSTRDTDSSHAIDRTQLQSVQCCRRERCVSAVEVIRQAIDSE